MATTDLPTPQGIPNSTFTPPPTDGSLTLTQIFDHHYLKSRDHTLFRYEDDAGKVIDIEWGRAVPAIHLVAQIVLKSVTMVSSARPVVAILAAADSVTYYTTIAGIMRAGCIAFPISVRNSDAAVAHVIRSTGANYMFLSQDPGMQKLAEVALQKLNNEERQDFKMMPMPSFESLYSGSAEPSDFLPSIKNGDLEAQALIMHSSGSTTFPKPIPFTYKIMMQSGLLPYFGEVNICGDVLSAHAVPMFHLMGAIQIAWTAYTGVIMTVFRPGWPPIIPTPDRVFSGAIATKCNLMFCVPAFLENWEKDPQRVEKLSKFKTIVFAGGPLQPTVGDRLTQQGVCLVPLYGQTETATVTLFLPKRPPPEGWDYWRVRTTTQAIIFKRRDGALIRQQTTPTHQPAILNTEIDGVPALNTNDLIARHPTNPELWRVHGRGDDQIMHSSGEKASAICMYRDILSKDPKISSAIMFGRGRFHAGVIVTPVTEEPVLPNDEDWLSRYRNAIWPTVTKANQFAPQHSRIFKEMILVADKSKPFEFTPKGTPRRQAVLNAYSAEIDAAYEAVKQSSQTHLVAPIQWELSNSLHFVREAVEKILTNKVEDNDDLFQYGCDSLQATWIRNTILHALRSTSKINTHDIPHNFVYANPTIHLLSEYLVKVAKGSHLRDIKHQTQVMLDMARNYSTDFAIAASGLVPDSSKEVVLLTGSTGAFGSYILDALLRSDDVVKVYALNRSGHSSSLQRQTDAFIERGLDPDILTSSKVVFVDSDLSANLFGLDYSVYHELIGDVTCVMHNAWQVDFNISLASLEPLVRGTRRLIDFSLSCRVAPRFVFTSSAGVFRSTFIYTNGFDYTAAEEPLADPAISAGWGYGESKWVAEYILEEAAKTTTLKPVIVRTGQLTGGANGAWNIKEWFPSLVKSSQDLKCLPDVPGSASWIPIDIAAKALVELRLSKCRYIHLLHPRPVTASIILQRVSSALRIPLVPYSQWIGAIEQTSQNEGSDRAASETPALQLLEFFRSQGSGNTNNGEAFGFPSLQTTNLEQSATLGNLRQLGIEDVDKWLNYWRGAGFIV
ncbi:acetyl-CoA synthetase-like protein [Armillaria solidipes]|uniref:Acetyl-CoA synthetase-like protein n=1 Tax=Armillaria solidipes TaxID=1076256 RepID=A0A2H3BLD1_9AGAR|nr:acetyl-CoA synthetase-like protein [Armillaria solidipes]